MTDQPRLFSMPTEALILQAHWEWPQGWVAVVRWRRHGESWDGGASSFYDSLGTGELLDVLASELARALES